jgi:drug/metabolite transporter (DMT)-like permease
MRISKGVQYMLAASFTFALMNVFVKAIPHIPAVEIILFRSIVSLVISVVMLNSQSVSIWGNNKPVLLARGISGAIALLIFFTLLQQIPLAAASSLAYLAPIFTTILGIFLVKERVLPIQWTFFILSFTGVLIIQGFDSRIDWIHLVMGIGTSFFMGLAYNFIRILKTLEHPLVIIFYFPLVMLPISGVWSAFVWVMPVGWDWVHLLLVGVLTQIAQYYMTKSYQSEVLSKVSIVSYVGIVFSLSFGFFFFGEVYNGVTFLGMILVIAGVVANVLFKK